MTQTAGPDPSVDPRVARTREVVLAAAAEALAVEGFERVSIDTIAERSGVARSTIYRNWPDRQCLLAEAFRKAHAEQLLVPPSGDLEHDLRRMADALIAKLQSEEWARTVPSLVGAAIHGGPLQDLARSFCQERHLDTRSIFEAAVARGRIGAEDQIDSAIERFVAPFFLRRLFSQLPLDQDFVDTQVAATLAQVAG